MKSLIIVESPAKAKTIKSFLGNDYEVIASKGHIRDLPKKSFGIKIQDNQFIPQYEISADHKEIVKNLKTLAKNCDEIYLATDEDREGEAIAFHIASIINKDPLKLPRIVFHEITQTAILNALQNPRHLNIDSINAQQARRLLDRIVGYKLSPLLSSKIQSNLSAGRVQSAALKIIIDKEREILDFKPQKFYEIQAVFKKNLEAEFLSLNGKKIEKLEISTQEISDEIIKATKNSKFKVVDIEKKTRKTSPQPPFMTSSLQQAASSSLGFAPKKTMMIAQNLYEGVKIGGAISGLITYMRTDSLNLAKEAVEAARDFIEKNFGEKYLPKSPNIFTTKSKNAQEAHEAIRPTNVYFTPQMAAKFLDSDQLKLYTLIYNRFLACQMSQSISNNTNVILQNDETSYKISGRIIVFDGFYKIYGTDDKDRILPSFKIGDFVELQSLKSLEKFTEPPARYSEAGLVKKLENLEIGRPSTYAPIISLLASRKYVEIDKKQLIPTPIAFKIIELLEQNFKNIVDSKFTQKMEAKLDLIADKKEDWQEVLSDFYFPFIKQIEDGKISIKSQKVLVKIDEKCPKCGGELVKRSGRFGEFIACLNFPKCKYSRNLNTDLKEEKAKKEVKKAGFLCPLCGGDVVERFSKRGKFFGCSNYPECKFVSNYPLSDKKCPNCGEIMVIKELKSGTFIECLKCKTKEAK